MRHETCLTCRMPDASDPQLRMMILLGESIGDFTHHHHTVTCEGCAAWWFDDVVIGGLGIPVPVLRDTKWCDCPEELPQYTSHAITVPCPEGQCSCTKAQVAQNSLPIRLSAGKQEAPPSHATLMRREIAVHEIAARIADRDAFVISVPPGALAAATATLQKLNRSACYLDIGIPVVTVLRSPHLGEAAAMAAAQLPGTAVAVFTVPKTIPARQLSRLLGHDIPADGSQDLLMLQASDAHEWPNLLIDAIGEVDPQYAAAVYAADIRNMS